MLPVTGQEENALLRLAASLERASEHPLAAAIVRGAEARKATLVAVENFQSQTGKGVTGTVEGHNVAIGSARLLEGLSIDPTPLLGQAETLRHEGQTVMLVAIDGRAEGILGVADPVKPSTPEAIKLLHEAGLRVVMLTGDSKTTAEAVARQLGIDDVQAEVRSRKARLSSGFRRQGIRLPWRVTALTTHLLSRRQTSALRWERARMLRWKARA